MAGTGLGVLATALGVGASHAASGGAADGRVSGKGASKRRGDVTSHVSGVRAALVPDDKRDQSGVLQRAIDRAARKGCAVLIPPGRFVIGAITLREGTVLLGAVGRSTLMFAGGASFIVGDGADNVRLSGLRIDGLGLAKELVVLRSCRNFAIEDVVFRGASGNGIGLTLCSGRVHNCEVSDIGLSGIFSLDAVGLEISSNVVRGCQNNGILVWRSKPGADGTIVSDNRIFEIGARDGGSGQNGNGVNVYRAGGVTVSGNQIHDCAYSAVRGNAASNIQIVGNSCSGIGEVALYSEFGFQGALISSNIVDTAATGISVTNFNEGGRLAVVQGNLIRNLFRREHEPQDKRGEGITVEADASVVGNTIEGAATLGIAIGWGPYMRDVVASGNVVRNCRVGIGISADRDGGACLVAQNLISGARDGAIKAMDHGRIHGPELAGQATQTERVTISGNVVA